VLFFVQNYENINICFIVKGASSGALENRTVDTAFLYVEPIIIQMADNSLFPLLHPTALSVGDLRTLSVFLMRLLDFFLGFTRRVTVAAGAELLLARSSSSRSSSRTSASITSWRGS
jgi:hypothetical protein